MKWCSGCRKELAETAFHRKGSGLASRCKGCRSEHHKAWYRRNRDKRVRQCKEAVARWRKKTAALVVSMKKKPCMDCRHRFPPVCMDFDHVRGKKVFDISNAVNSKGMSLIRLMEEIAKCDLVCSNCHRIRTEKRRRSSARRASAR